MGATSVFAECDNEDSKNIGRELTLDRVVVVFALTHLPVGLGGMDAIPVEADSPSEGKTPCK